MNVLLLIDSLGSGGAQKQCVTIAKFFKEQGFDIAVLCYSKENFFEQYLEDAGVPIHWRIEENYLKRLFRIRHFIRCGSYDAVISFMDVPNFINCFAAIGGKKWKVITNELSSKQSTFSTRRGKIFAWFQRYSDSIVCNSHNAKAMWENHFPKYKDKLSVIYNPVLMPEITSTYISKKNGKLHVVVAASYQYLKNPIGVVKAIALMNEEERSKLLVNWYGRIEPVLGNSKAYDETKELIEHYHLQSTIYLHEATKNISNKMGEADVVALFSKLEGLPNAICEGMMIGKPIVMTRVSDYNDLVDEQNGFLCDWDSQESIKDALIMAIRLSEEQLQSMGRNSKSKAEKLFSKDIITSQWINLIKKKDKHNKHRRII